MLSDGFSSIFGHDHGSEHHCCGCAFTLILLALGSIVAWFLYTKSQTCRYYIRISAFYYSVFMSGVFSMFGSIPTYFYNAGAVIAMACLRFFCNLWLDIDVEIRGNEKVAKASGPNHKPLLLISNHQSALDVYVMSRMWPAKCSAMLKSSLKYIPFFNISAFLSNSIFVNRFDKTNAHKAVDESVDLMHNRRLKIWVFPEGTRHHGHGMLPFKKGAFNIAVQAQIDIVPVAISDLRSFYSKTDKYFHNNGKIIVQVMDPVSTKGLTTDDVPSLCKQIRDEMIKVYDEISLEAEQKYLAAGGMPATKKTDDAEQKKEK